MTLSDALWDTILILLGYINDSFVLTGAEFIFKIKLPWDNKNQLHMLLLW